MHEWKTAIMSYLPYIKFICSFIDTYMMGILIKKFEIE